MKPCEWAKSEHGLMLAQALDAQFLSVFVKYTRLGLEFSVLLQTARYVFEERLRQHGKPGQLPKSLNMVRLLANADRVLQGFVIESTKVVSRLCKTWLVGDVTTTDGSVVDWRMVDATFHAWHLKISAQFAAGGNVYVARLLRKH